MIDALFSTALTAFAAWIAWQSSVYNAEMKAARAAQLKEQL